ncbi:MAG: hypothetical protein NWE95_11730 [Candidatus Bathyarchaeota archaeon]|nr:hypothetical protein [Candidatus Bathyarchaeota archaeon]
MSSQDNVQTGLLREILKWTKFSGMRAVKEVLNSTLDTPEKKLLYQLSDGSKGSVELCKATGIASTETVTKNWKNWTRLGLGENLAVKGGKRFKRAFDVEEFGIEVPEPTVEKKSAVAKEQESQASEAKL